MRLNLKTHRAYCYPLEFFINGIHAFMLDFGKVEDTFKLDEDSCGNAQFKAKPCNSHALDKYEITEDEYVEIIEQLKVLGVGACRSCET